MPRRNTQPNKEQTKNQKRDSYTKPGSKIDAPVVADQQNSQQSDAAPTNKKKRALYAIKRAGKFIIGLKAEYLMALFTLGIFVSSVLQWSATENALRISSRAYVGVSEVKIWKTGPADVAGRVEKLPPDHGITLGPSPILDLQLKNTGTTPALNTEGWTVFSYCDHLPDENFSERNASTGEVIKSHGTIPKDGTATFERAIPIDQSKVDNILRETRFLDVYGQMSYQDVFGKSHRTSFCWFYHPHVDEMAVCPNGNWMK